MFSRTAAVTLTLLMTTSVGCHEALGIRQTPSVERVEVSNLTIAGVKAFDTSRIESLEPRTSVQPARSSVPIAIDSIEVSDGKLVIGDRVDTLAAIDFPERVSNLDAQLTISRPPGSDDLVLRFEHASLRTSAPDLWVERLVGRVSFGEPDIALDDLRVSELTYGWYRATGVSAEGRVEGHTIVVDAHGAAYEGDVRVKGRITLPEDGDPVAYDLRGRVANVDLENVSRDLKLPQVREALSRGATGSSATPEFHVEGGAAGVKTHLGLEDLSLL